MASEKHRANFISSIMRALLAVNILLFVLAAIWMFFTSSARDVYIFGIISCSCLIASVGFQLISRWNRLGFYVVIAVCICASLTLYSLFDTELISFMGSYGAFMPFALSVGLILLLAILLFLVKDRRFGKNCWSQMSDGLDIKHFRHIYQLTSVLILTCVGLTYYLSLTKSALPHKEKINYPEVAANRVLSYALLDSANVTLDEVIAIEPMIDSIPTNLQVKYNKRIFALKHLLLSGIMAKEHDASNIVNISKIHLGEYSESQQQILDWYLGLSDEGKQKWYDCPPVSNLSDFKLKLTEIIEK